MNSNLKMEMLSSKELEQILGGTVVITTTTDRKSVV